MLPQWAFECLIPTSSKAPFSEVSIQVAIFTKEKHNLLIFFTDFEGGIKLGEMLFRTKIIGFVGTGKNTSYPGNRLILWDDIQHRPFGELNFKEDVLNVKLRKDR